MLTQPSETGGESDPEFSTSDQANTTVLAVTENEEISKMVEEVSESIAKLTTKKKRLSGAQRRRMKRMHQMGEKGKTQDAPKELSEIFSTSAEAVKRFRSPKEQNTVKQQPKKKKSSPPSSKTGKPGQTLYKGDFHQNQLKGVDKECPDTKKVSTAAESSVKAGKSEKKSQATRKRKMAADKGNGPPSYAKVGRGHYKDEHCSAVIDSSSKFPVDQHREVEDLVNNSIMEPKSK